MEERERAGAVVCSCSFLLGRLVIDRFGLVVISSVHTDCDTEHYKIVAGSDVLNGVLKSSGNYVHICVF